MSNESFEALDPRVTKNAASLGKWMRLTGVLTLVLLGLFVLVALVWLFSSASFLSALPGLGPLGLVYGGFMVAWVVALVVQSMWLLKAGKAFGRVSEVGLSGELKLAFSRLRDVMIAEVAIGVLLSFGRVVTSLFGLPLL